MNIFFIYTNFIDINNIEFIRLIEIINIFKNLKYDIYLLTKYYDWNKIKLYEIKKQFFNNIFIYNNLQLMINQVNLKYTNNIFINFNENVLSLDFIINVPEYNINLNNSLTNIISNDQKNILSNSYYFPFNTEKKIINNNYQNNPIVISNDVNFINLLSENINNKHKIKLFMSKYSDKIKNYNFEIIESQTIYDLEELFKSSCFVITDTLFNLNLSFKYNIPVILYSDLDFDYKYKTYDINQLLFYYEDFYNNRDICRYIGENTILNYKNNINDFINYINTKIDLHE
jgi:hypothetical protein